MRLGFKLLLALLAVVLVPLVLMNRQATEFFHRFNAELWEKQMIETARLTGMVWQMPLAEADRIALLNHHAEASNTRIRWWDSPVPRYDSGGAEDADLRDDPEVLKAWESRRYQARYALNAARSRMYYFVALPVEVPGTGELLGVAQVIRHTGPITGALLRMKDHQRLATWISGGAASALALLFAWLLTRRLRRLEQAARDYAESGDASGFQARGYDEVAQLARAFQEMAQALEERQTYNQAFVLTTLHELRTPLTAIRGAAEILATRDSLSPEQRRQFSHNVQFQAERLARLVGELYELTSLDLTMPGEPWETVDLHQWLPDVLARLQPGLQHPVSVETGEGSLQTHLQCDRMEQVLGNLLQNADRYSRTYIRVQVTRDADALKVAVLDDGPGLRAEDLPRIFDRFFTTVPRGRTLDHGSGLGLAMVKSIVEHHRGTVFAGNRPEGGACIGFRLPTGERRSSLQIGRTRLVR